MTAGGIYARSAAYTLVNADAPVLVIALHGLGGDRNQPLGTFGDFGNEVAVLAPDQRAHGETRAPIDPARLTFSGLADDIVALIRALGLDEKPVYFAGISMGAAVSLALLRSGELDVRGASLVRPAFGAESVPVNLALMPYIASLLRTYGPTDGAAMLTATSAYRSMERESPITARSLVEQLYKPMALERIARLATIPAQLAYVSAADFDDISLPVQILGAHGDPVHPVGLARKWADLIPSATLIEVPSRDADPGGYAQVMRTAVVEHAKTSLV